MDYEAEDRYHSLGAVTCVKNGIRFFIAANEEESATDIPDRARRFRTIGDAETYAEKTREEWRKFGAPFDWEAVPYFTIFQKETSLEDEEAIP